MYSDKSDKIFDMIVRQHNAQKIDIKQIKLKHIHKEIIELKQENRNIGDKIRSYKIIIFYNQIKMCKVQGHAYMDWYRTYEDRVKRDNKTIEYLEKLQKLNSKLINKHRAKQRELRSELQELQKSLGKLDGDVL